MFSFLFFFLGSLSYLSENEKEEEEEEKTNHLLERLFDKNEKRNELVESTLQR